MLRIRRQAADQVAASLFEAEAAISDAVLKVSKLVGTVEVARSSANLSLLVGSEAGRSSIQCLAALGLAKEELIRAHQGFTVAQREIGLGAVSFGDGGGGKPVDDVAPVGTAHISIAA